MQHWGTVMVGTGLYLYNTGVQYRWGWVGHRVTLGYSTDGDNSVTGVQYWWGQVCHCVTLGCKPVMYNTGMQYSRALSAIPLITLAERSFDLLSRVEIRMNKNL